MSLYINVKIVIMLFSIGDMRGHGSIQAKGGAGSPGAGGGAGGRIAVHTRLGNEYYGDLVAVGGDGSDIGGPGTVFIEDMLVQDITWSRRLYLDGRNVDPPKPVIISERNPRVQMMQITEENNAHVAFDEVLLQNMVSYIWLIQHQFCIVCENCGEVFMVLVKTGVLNTCIDVATTPEEGQ